MVWFLAPENSIKVHDQPQTVFDLLEKVIWKFAEFFGQETFVHCEHLGDICHRVFGQASCPLFLILPNHFNFIFANLWVSRKQGDSFDLTLCD